MRLASVVPHRIRSLAPEALAFGTIGAANTLLYLVIVYVTMPIGAVKANVLATMITTALSYLANRYWTYRSRPKRSKRREGTLFFGFNLAGMVIQSGLVGVVKYGFGLSEERDKFLLLAVTLVGIVLATVFRFWAYRTLVFRPHPIDHAPPTSAAEVLAEALENEELDHQAASEIDEFEQLTGLLEAELNGPVQRRRSIEGNDAVDDGVIVDGAIVGSALDGGGTDGPAHTGSGRRPGRQSG